METLVRPAKIWMRMTVRCTECNGPPCSLQGSGKIVTGPAAAAGDDIGGWPAIMRDVLFCAVCKRGFSEGWEGAAVFVRSETGITHV